MSKAIGHGLFAGFLPDGNLAIDCYFPVAPPIRGARVVVQRADVPDLLAVIASGVAPMDRAEPAPDPGPGAEAFWSAAFCAALPSKLHLHPDESVSNEEKFAAHAAAIAGARADAALVEWRKRWRP